MRATRLKALMWFVIFFNEKSRPVTIRDLMASSHCELKTARGHIAYLVKHEYLIESGNGYKPKWDISLSYFDSKDIRAWNIVEARLPTKERIELARILRDRQVSLSKICRYLKCSKSWVTHNAPAYGRRWQSKPTSLKFPHVKREEVDD